MKNDTTKTALIIVGTLVAAFLVLILVAELMFGIAGS